MRGLLLRSARALALVVLLMGFAGTAPAATLPLNYVHDDGNATITITGSVTFNDAIWVPNQDIFDSLIGLTAVSITVSGPGVPGGSIAYTLADINGWVFQTDSQNRIIDLNFFGDPVNGCYVDGFEVFQLGFYCGDPEELSDGDYLALKRLVLSAQGQAASVPVPALDPAMLALLAGLLAAATALGAPALLRRRR